jgi:hypothetical protein
MVTAFYVPVLYTFVCTPIVLHPHMNTMKGRSLEMDIFSKIWKLCVSLHFVCVLIVTEKSSKYPSRVTFPFRLCTEAEFLDVIGTKVLRVFLLAIHSPYY